MRLYVLPLFAALACAAHAASLPLDNKLPVVVTNLPDGVKPTAQPTDNVNTDGLKKEKESDANLENIEEVPVKVYEVIKTEVVTDEAPQKNVNDINKRYKPEVNEINKVQDLSDFSEFESANKDPECESENVALPFIRNALNKAHETIQVTIDSFSNTIQGWVKTQSVGLPTEEQISSVKSVIENNISKLNSTIQGYFSSAQAEKLADLTEDPSNHIEIVETDLKNLETNFKKEVKGALQSVKQGTQPANNATGNLPPVIQNIQQVIQEGFNNITSSLQNMFNQNSGDNSENNIWAQFGQNFNNLFGQGNTGAPGTQSDEGTNRPSLIQSIQNIFRPPVQAQQTVQNPQPNNQQPQADQPAQPNRPIIQAIQNNPIVQSISGVFNRPPQAKPQSDALVSSSVAPLATQAEGSNAVPAPPQELAHAAELPLATTDEQKEKPQELPPGPVQQAIQNIPLVQGIAGAVQRIQSTISNPEKPRKIGFFLHGFPGGHGGHGGHGGGGNTTDKHGAGLDNVPSSDAPGLGQKEEKPEGSQLDKEDPKPQPEPSSTDVKLAPTLEVAKKTE